MVDRSNGRRLIACAIAVMLAPAAQATESIFANTYLVDTQPAGGHECEQWLINKRGKAAGEYNEWYLRCEVEFGITDKLQIAPYINVRYQNVYRSSADGRTEAENEARTLSGGKREHLTWFFGPTLAYADKNFFVSATWEHQMPWAKVYEAEYLPEKVGGRLYGNERERNILTFKFGMPF